MGVKELLSGREKVEALDLVEVLLKETLEKSGDIVITTSKLLNIVNMIRINEKRNAKIEGLKNPTH